MGVKKILLIYNPISGEGTFKERLDSIIEILQKFGFIVIVHRINPGEDLTAFIKKSDIMPDTILAAGGDGTIHQVVNMMFKANIEDVPLGIIPAGTSNDIARYFSIPMDPCAAAKIIGNNNISSIDLGKANDQYFVNVFSGGFIIDVPHTTSVRLKNLAGRMAYYIKGIEKLPNIKPIHVKLLSPEMIIDEKILLFIILNGSIAGGFRNLAPASMQDGKLDILIIKPVPIPKLLSLFVKILKGEHIGDPALIYFKSSGPIEINCQNSCSDIDGEKGPEFPIRINIYPNKLSIYLP
jgi:diacylglycerol kinase (ATP)